MEPAAVAARKARVGAARAGRASAAASSAALGSGRSALADLGVPSARAFGATHEQIRAETASSPFCHDGVFANGEPTEMMVPSAGNSGSLLRDMIARPGRPGAPVPVLPVLLDPEPADLSVTWLGHASNIVDVDGVRILTDPVLSQRCSPSQLAGPARMHRAPVTVAGLPPVDVVLISHDHYDHLDFLTIVELARRQPEAVFLTPIGVGAHLLAWGIDRSRVRQADWGGTLTLTVRGTAVDFFLAPARHFSGRGLVRNLTQWGSWAVVGPRHRVFFSGDTGFSERYADLGASHGPFDLSLIAIGAYDVAWPAIHLNPEEALAVHSQLNGDRRDDALFVPLHWGTFNLARHPWAEPVSRLLAAAALARVPVLVPPPGGTIDVASRSGSGTKNPDWWEHCA